MLEKLTRCAYPDQSEENLSRTRAGELLSLLTNWPKYVQLYTAMDIAPKELAYEMLKTMAQRCERSKRMAQAMHEEMETPKVEGPERRGGGESLDTPPPERGGARGAPRTRCPGLHMEASHF
ncbi:unnamed protein product [Heligmosomoides polygyrus]|uniref:GRIP domain-containing protein n=1 Tax=Heligmosomoides polygyrus TaxID=6339 RepID=A0A183FU94_HELPZ|nr:unnamed protein product [Heligmosomoides polygyrus]